MSLELHLQLVEVIFLLCHLLKLEQFVSFKKFAWAVFHNLGLLPYAPEFELTQVPPTFVVPVGQVHVPIIQREPPEQMVGLEAQGRPGASGIFIFSFFLKFFLDYLMSNHVFTAFRIIFYSGLVRFH